MDRVGAQVKKVVMKRLENCVRGDAKLQVSSHFVVLSRISLLTHV